MQFKSKERYLTIDKYETQWLKKIEERVSLRHRDNDVGAAYIWADGSQTWYKNGYIHRKDGPAFFERSSYSRIPIYFRFNIKIKRFINVSSHINKLKLLLNN